VSSFEFGAGVLLALGASGAPEPSPNEYSLPRSGDLVEQGAATGVSYGAGLAVEARVYEIVGFSVGALYRRDALAGDVTRAGENATLSLAASGLHLPILLRGHYPLEPVAPFVEIGAELVIPGLGKAEVEPEGAHSAVASSEPHTFLVVGAGAELNGEALGGFRPSAALSVGFRPGRSDDLQDRATVLPSDAVVYDASPSWQATLLLGMAYYW
jgi:hypothetical protein